MILQNHICCDIPFILIFLVLEGLLDRESYVVRVGELKVVACRHQLRHPLPMWDAKNDNKDNN